VIWCSEWSICLLGTKTWAYIIIIVIINGDDQERVTLRYWEHDFRKSDINMKINKNMSQTPPLRHTLAQQLTNAEHNTTNEA
jgi:hypothetical protein